MTKRDDIQTALITLAKPGMTSGQLQKDIRKAFPTASKKDIRLAAFGAMISIVEQAPETALELQDLAVTKATEPTPE